MGATGDYGSMQNSAPGPSQGLGLASALSEPQFFLSIKPGSPLVPLILKSCVSDCEVLTSSSSGVSLSPLEETAGLRFVWPVSFPAAACAHCGGAWELQCFTSAASTWELNACSWSAFRSWQIGSCATDSPSLLVLVI